MQFLCSESWQCDQRASALYRVFCGCCGGIAGGILACKLPLVEVAVA